MSFLYQKIRRLFVKAFQLTYLKCFFPFYYRYHARRPVDQNKIIFITYQVAGLEPNMAAMYETLQKMRTNMHYSFYLENALRMAPWPRFLYNTRFIRDLATARYVLLSHPVVPLSAITLRKETMILQLWHGCGAFKKWGYAAMDAEGWSASRSRARILPYYKNTTYALASSPNVVKDYAWAFHMPQESILPLGVPRTDKLFRSDYIPVSKELVHSFFPQAEGRKLILFCPTFRGNSIDDAHYDLPFDIERLKRELGEKFALLIKMHPFVSSPVLPAGTEDFAYVADSSMDVNDLMGAADVLITDYSSLIFEYALLDRPMLFYSPDYEQYATGRGFFTKYTDMIPGRLVPTLDELIDILRREEYDMERVRSFREWYMSACDGHSAERIIDTLFLEEKKL